MGSAAHEGERGGFRARPANTGAGSIRGALELIPGTLLQPPGLETPEMFALRRVPTSSSASITVGTAGDLAAFSASPHPRSIPMRTLVVAFQPPGA